MPLVNGVIRWSDWLLLLVDNSNVIERHIPSPFVDVFEKIVLYNS